MMKNKYGSFQYAAVAIIMLVIVFAVYAALAVTNSDRIFAFGDPTVDKTFGMWQKIGLYVPEAKTESSDLIMLRGAHNYTSENKGLATRTDAREGTEYYLNKIDEVYDISNGQDVVLQMTFTNGVKKFNAENWKHVAMRYMTVLDAQNGSVVASFLDEEPDEQGKNSDGYYQIAYENYSEAECTIQYTIPNEAFEYNKSYYVVFGSATAGNDNRRQLYAPAIFLITTGDQNGKTIASKNDIQQLVPHEIELNIIRGKDDKESTVDFNRYTGYWEYETGDPITDSVVGQEIALVDTAAQGLSTAWRITGESGTEIRINPFIKTGPSSAPYRDTRFTMPNEKVTVDVIFGYKVFFYISDESKKVTNCTIEVWDEERKYYAEEDGSFILPAGEYNYSIVTNTEKSLTKELTVTEDMIIQSLQSGEAADHPIVSFVSEYSDARISVYDANDNVVSPVYGNTYVLPNGEYTYKATARDHVNIRNVSETVEFTAEDAVIEVLAEATAKSAE